MKKILLGSLGLLGAGAFVISMTIYTFSSPDLPWVWRFVSMIALGTVLSLAMLGVTRPWVLFRLGQLPYCSPNWITLWRMPVLAIGYLIFFNSDGRLTWLFTGFLLSVAGVILDRIDGKAAKVFTQRLAALRLPDNYLRRGSLTVDNRPWAWYHFKEKDKDGIEIGDQRVFVDEWLFRLCQSYTRMPMFIIEVDTSREQEVPTPARRVRLSEIGEWLDPAVDKICILPLFIYLAYKGFLIWPVVVPVILVDLFGTLMRRPFIDIDLRLFRGLKSNIREGKASAMGKTKFIWHFVTLLLLMPVSLGWLTVKQQNLSLIIADITLGLGLLAGILSVLSRLYLRDALLMAFGMKRAYEKFTETYEHDVTPTQGDPE